MEPRRLGFLSEEDEKKDYEHMKGQVMDEVKRMFKPEFLNRIDEIIVFHSLTKDDMKQIIGILLKDLEKRCQEQMDIQLRVSGKAKEHLIDTSFDSKYGARPLKRAIQSQIEDPLAEKILRGEVKRGSAVSVGRQRKNAHLQERGALRNVIPFFKGNFMKSCRVALENTEEILYNHRKQKTFQGGHILCQ